MHEQRFYWLVRFRLFCFDVFYFFILFSLNWFVLVGFCLFGFVLVWPGLVCFGCVRVLCMGVCGCLSVASWLAVAGRRACTLAAWWGVASLTSKVWKVITICNASSPSKRRVFEEYGEASKAERKEERERSPDTYAFFTQWMFPQIF
jgi:hypothetical protein